MQVKGFLLFLSVFALQIVSARYTGDPFRHDYKKGMKGFGYSYEHGQLESHRCKAPFGTDFSRKKEIFGDVNVYGGNKCLKGRKKPISDGTEVEAPEEGFEGIAEEVPFEGMPEAGPEEEITSTEEEELFEGIFGEGVAEEIGFEGLPETGPEEVFEEFPSSEETVEELPSSEIVSKECPRVYDLVYNDTYALNKSDLYEFETLIEDGLEYNYDLDIEWREDEDYVLIRGEGKGKEVTSKGGYFIWSNNQQKEVSCEGSESANCTECVDPDCSLDQTLQGNLRGKTFYNYLNEQEHDWSIEFDYMEYEGTIDISKGGSQAHSSEDTFDIDYELFSSSEDEALKDLHSYLNKKEHSDLMSQAKSQIESTSYNQQLKLASFVALIYFL